MSRYLVTFRSHAVGAADEHHVGLTAVSPLAAIVEARKAVPPPHDWAIAEVHPWPPRCRTVDAAIAKIRRVG